MRCRGVGVCFLSLITALAVCVSSAPPSFTVKIPTRDGVLLNTVISSPEAIPTKKYPIVLDRTPYGTHGLGGAAEVWTKQGFLFAAQDMRGRYGSTGNYSFWEHCSPDAADTIDYLKKQYYSDGHVFQQGTSANGIANFMSTGAGPYPAADLKGQFIIVGAQDLHSMCYQGGAYRDSLITGWLGGIKEPQYAETIKAQEAYDSFWNKQDISANYKHVAWPSVLYGGFYDIFCQWTIKGFNGYQENGLIPGLATLFMDPLGHCGGGAVTMPGARDQFPIAQAYAVEVFKLVSSMNMTDAAIVAAVDRLRQAAGLHKINVYVMGPEGAAAAPKGNYWTGFDSWPKTAPTSLYLAAGGTLDTTAPVQGLSQSFVFNPADPVASFGGNNLLLPKCGPQDQREVSKGRTDYLEFTSKPFGQDTTVIGEVYADLFVVSNATDTDIVAKWVDVYPDGTRMLLQDGIIRMRWLDAEAPQPTCITPGKVYKIRVDLLYTAFVINQGHSIGLDVTSSNSPRFSVNTNNCRPLINPGEPVWANNTIAFGGPYPSALVIPTLA